MLRSRPVLIKREFCFAVHRRLYILDIDGGGIFFGTTESFSELSINAKSSNNRELHDRSMLPTKQTSRAKLPNKGKTIRDSVIAERNKEES